MVRNIIYREIIYLFYGNHIDALMKTINFRNKIILPNII